MQRVLHVFGIRVEVDSLVKRFRTSYDPMKIGIVRLNKRGYKWKINIEPLQSALFPFIGFVIYTLNYRVGHEYHFLHRAVITV